MFQSTRQIRSESFLNVIFYKVISDEKGVNHDVKPLSGIDSSVAGQKFEGMLVSPFL